MRILAMCLLALLLPGSVFAQLTASRRLPVMLEVIGAPGPCTQHGFMPLEFMQNRPDGTSAPFPSTPIPPPGSVMVVTEVDWQLNGGSPRSSHLLRMFVVNKASGSSFRALESPVHLDDLGGGGAVTAVTTGFVFSSAAALCLDVISISGAPSGLLQHALVRGYYVPE